MKTLPTKEQEAKIKELIRLGYKYHKGMSESCAGVIFVRYTDLYHWDDFYLFGLEGEIMHNPHEHYTFKQMFVDAAKVTGAKVVSLVPTNMDNAS